MNTHNMYFCGEIRKLFIWSNEIALMYMLILTFTIHIGHNLIIALDQVFFFFLLFFLREKNTDIFLISLQKHTLWVFSRSAPASRF